MLVIVTLKSGGDVFPSLAITCCKSEPAPADCPAMDVNDRSILNHC